MEQKRDDELVAAHLAGQPGAFDALVSRYATGLYSFFVHLVGQSAAADDLVQETFLQVHLAAASFDPQRSFKPWLYTIAANKGRDYLRARARKATQSLDVTLGGDDEAPSGAAQLPSEAPGATEETVAEEQREQVRQLINQMPEHLRLILILGYYQRLPYAEIAEILGIPVGTVKSRLHAAVNQFAKLWLARTEAPSS